MVRFKIEVLELYKLTEQLSQPTYIEYTKPKEMAMIELE
jgi:hypothetical protein